MRMLRRAGRHATNKHKTAIMYTFKSELDERRGASIRGLTMQIHEQKRIRHASFPVSQIWPAAGHFARLSRVKQT
jgi:hypothetical protein